MNKLFKLLDFSKYRKFLNFPLTFVLVIVLFGCATIPQQEFNVYRNNFNIAKSTAQDIMLSAKVTAETIAKSQDNPDGPNVKHEKLTERIAALDARLEALELIAQYNEVLVHLASGTDPAVVKSSLETFRDGLSSFGISHIGKLVAKATPLFGIISQGVSIIDNMIKKKKFKEAVNAGQKPILSIIEILQEDADRIHDIETQMIGFKQDREYIQIAGLKKRLHGLANTYRKSDGLDNLISKYNNLIITLKADNETTDLLKIEHFPGETDLTNPSDLETMRTLVDQTAQCIERYNKFSDQLKAHEDLISEYKNLLMGTSNSFISLNTSVLSNYRAATVGFITHALNLRKALIEYQEAKQK